MAQWLKEPNAGDWYQSAGNTFEIVGVDVASEIVLVQHFDGALEEIEFDAWAELEAVPCAAPEDFSGALDLDAEDREIDPISSAGDDDAFKRLYIDSR
ncbi:DUF6763 family protein [Hydrocarboniphaga sp.]|uniref:DUF6763 family protein n=1 Tax=Hydrocarboniphaga sp. TaxID=2033016 RepID=UPI003D09C163